MGAYSIACSVCVVLVVTALAVILVAPQHLAVDVKLHQAATSAVLTLVHQLVAEDYSAASRDGFVTVVALQLQAVAAKLLLLPAIVVAAQLQAVVAKSLLLLVTVVAVQLLAVAVKSQVATHVVVDVTLAASHAVVL